MDGRVLSPSSSFAEELISGLSREDEGGGSTPLCSRTRYVPQCSRLCIRSRSAMHTPSERDGNRTRRPLGFGGPTVPRAHFRTTGWGI